MAKTISPTKSILKGALYATIVSLVLILVFALVVNMASLSGTTVRVISQIIKVVSIFYGVAITLKTIERRGWLYGGIVGMIYTPIAFFVLSILNTDFNITTAILTEMLFAIAIGVVSAFLINMGKNRTV